MKKLFFINFIFIFQFFSNMSFALDIKKCSNVFDSTPNNILVNKALEEYSYQLSMVIGSYYSLYSIKEEKCPLITDDLHHLKKGIVYSAINMKLPSNKLDKRLGFKKCLLSHFEKDDEILDQKLIVFKNGLENLKATFRDYFDNTKKEYMKKYPQTSYKTFCKKIFAFVDYGSTPPKYTSLGKMFKKINEEAIISIKKSNSEINSYCSFLGCN